MFDGGGGWIGRLGSFAAVVLTLEKSTHEIINTYLALHNSTNLTIKYLEVSF